MANAYKTKDHVILAEKIKLNGKYHYGDIAVSRILSKTVVEKGPPTTFEIIDVRESDHRRTSLSPIDWEPTPEDYVYRLIVRCGSSIRRMTYHQRPGAKPLTKLIPHTSIREVERSDESKTGVFDIDDIVCVTAPFEYPSTESGSHANIVLERGTLLQITGPASTQKGGRHTKSDPNKAFYRIVLVNGEAHYDVYWKSSANVTHNEILQIVPSN
ncbi:hypothetical protein HYPSUDRAFT_78442 [Hypholoma sublateritium FD-334 SS-4]|uniref:Uncharacterized protein n=1 Tax=Hypholoma sublateritium (strain FD-334 SS-4) TaxID=945553 RepID=A0A0D2PJI6_HYPSF|nr:hypothetical protein HYPSUDRAFT_78442 [Hypholoma sublateritium FD-334 SS-4]